MSTVTIQPGALVRLDPSDQRVIQFDFDTLNLPVGVALTSYTLTITAIRQATVGAALTKDNAGYVSGSNQRKVQARFLATTATVGDLYEVECVGVSDETPAQQKAYSIQVLIENK